MKVEATKLEEKKYEYKIIGRCCPEMDDYLGDEEVFFFDEKEPHLMMNTDKYEIGVTFCPFCGDKVVVIPKLPPKPKPKESNLKDNISTGNHYVHEGWTLYTRSVRLKGGREQEIFFFSRREPRIGNPCALPQGYTVWVSKRTGLPYLRR